MNNPARTTAHLATLENRRQVLRSEFAAILPTDAAIVWEIGSGHGHFLTAYAQSHPNELCIGIDIATERTERAVRKRDRAKLSNLHFLQAEATMFLEMLPPGASFSSIYVLFPDPWPKSRHHKHRLMKPGFLSDIAGRAGEGARLYFRTDHGPYFVEVENLLRRHPCWRLVDEPWPFELSTVFQERADGFQSLVAAARPISDGAKNRDPA